MLFSRGREGADLLRRIPSIDIKQTTLDFDAVSLVTGQTALVGSYIQAGVPMSPDETYADLHLNALRLSDKPLEAIYTSLGKAAEFIANQSLDDAVIVGLTYPRLGVAAQRLFGFKSAYPNWRSGMPYKVVQKVASWDAASERLRRTQRYSTQPPVMATYLRTADFVGLFGND